MAVGHLRFGPGGRPFVTVMRAPHGLAIINKEHAQAGCRRSRWLLGAILAYSNRRCRNNTCSSLYRRNNGTDRHRPRVSKQHPGAHSVQVSEQHLYTVTAARCRNNTWRLTVIAAVGTTAALSTRHWTVETTVQRLSGLAVETTASPAHLRTSTRGPTPYYLWYVIVAASWRLLQYSRRNNGCTQSDCCPQSSSTGPSGPVRNRRPSWASSGRVPAIRRYSRNRGCYPQPLQYSVHPAGVRNRRPFLGPPPVGTACCPQAVPRNRSCYPQLLHWSSSRGSSMLATLRRPARRPAWRNPNRIPRCIVEPPGTPFINYGNRRSHPKSRTAGARLFSLLGCGSSSAADLGSTGARTAMPSFTNCVAMNPFFVRRWSPVGECWRDTAHPRPLAEGITVSHASIQPLRRSSKGTSHSGRLRNAPYSCGSRNPQRAASLVGRPYRPPSAAALGGDWFRTRRGVGRPRAGLLLSSYLTNQLRCYVAGRRGLHPPAMREGSQHVSRSLSRTSIAPVSYSETVTIGLDSSLPSFQSTPRRPALRAGYL